MRIAMLHVNPVPSDQANLVQVQRMADGFAQTGHAVRLTLPCSDPALTPAALRQRYGTSDRVDLQLVRSGKSFRLRLLRLVSSGWRHVGSGGVFYTRSAAVAVVLSWLRRPVVLELHAPLGVLSRRLRGRLLAALRRGRISRIVVISAALERLLRDELTELGLAMPDLVVAHDGCMIGAAVPPSAPDQRLRVGYAGHLYAGRGIELIVDLAARLPHMDFVVVGGKDPELSAWRARCEAVRNLRFQGQVAPAEVASFLAACDVLLAPYQRAVYTAEQGLETSRWMSPLKVFEYMAAGRAILASDLPVLGEVLRDGDNAVLCAPEDTQAWIAALKRLDGDRADLARLGEAARRDAERHYTWAARARAVLAGLESLR